MTTKDRQALRDRKAASERNKGLRQLRAARERLTSLEERYKRISVIAASDPTAEDMCTSLKAEVERVQAMVSEMDAKYKPTVVYSPHWASL